MDMCCFITCAIEACPIIRTIASERDIRVVYTHWNASTTGGYSNSHTQINAIIYLR